MNWKKFSIQLILWLVFSAVIPIIAIANKYDFVKEGKTKYTGWAIIAGVVVFVVIMVALRYILRLLKSTPSLKNEKKKDFITFLFKISYYLSIQ